ncbi:glycerophosphodiester phosphodiesterase [Ilyomonas limi]|uniref:Glycerophosphodiester phosphodiesterase n=1 Tax=Ilyomonas limi TaxID=2575867 RepID=A0A4U3L7T5_9BACT|nr:glycerophosphodiester phosphodiesterase family protein [Ilyomonas limi]TKK69916.1 glycerophosphodiester phosphodiesterase [Ilyomonas limi]
MKKLPVFMLLSLLASCATPKKSIINPEFSPNPVVAHRGAFKHNSFPENSIASLKEAIRLQCTGSEFDVWMTADDSLVIHHDPDYNHLTIETTNYNQLVAVPLSNGEPLPTLRRYLKAGLENNKHTRLVLEIKPSRISGERGKRVAEKVVKMVHQLGAAPMVVYISFDYDIMKKVEELDKSAVTQYLNGDKSPEQVKADGIDGIDYHLSVFRKQPEWIQSAKQNNIVLNAWTVNEKEDMQWLLDNGFNFITTNEPELLMEVAASQAALKK